MAQNGPQLHAFVNKTVTRVRVL